MTYYSYNDYLMHYGVKGMKWGVRHDPERVGRRFGRGGYQGSYGGSSATGNYSNKTRKRNAKRALKIGASIAAGVLAAGATAYLIKSGKVSKFADVGRKALAKKSASIAKSVSKETKQNPSKIAKEVKSAPSKITKDSAKIKDVSNTTSSGAVKKPAKLDPAAVKAGIKPLNHTSKAEDFKVINPDLKLSDDVKNILEKFDQASINSLPMAKQEEYIKAFGDGKLMNCTKCTNAAILRDMGYDVTAGRSTYGYEPGVQLMWWKNAKFESMSGKTLMKGQDPTDFYESVMSSIGKDSNPKQRAKTVATLNRKLSAFPEGAKGNLNVGGTNGFHSVEFRVEKGNVKIYDNQLSTEYSSLEEFFNKVPHHEPSAATWSRLDNCEPDIKAMLADDVIRAR